MNHFAAMNQSILLFLMLVFFTVGLVSGRHLNSPDSRARQEMTAEEEETPVSSAPAASDRSAVPSHWQPAHDRFEDALAEANPFERQLSLVHTAEKCSARDCFRLILQCQEDEMALAAISARWASLDPKGMFTTLQGWKKDDLLSNETVMGELMAVWSRSDPEEAYAVVDASQDRNIRDHAVRQLVGNLLYEDPEKAFDIANRGETTRLGLPGEFDDWADEDPEAMSDLVLGLPRSNFKLSVSRRLAVRWGKSDPENALQFAQQLGPLYREFAMESVAVGWMERDLDVAKDYVSQSTSGAALSRLGVHLAGKLAERDPAEAFAWVNQHMQGEARSKALSSLVGRGASNHPAAIAAIASELSPGDIRQHTLRVVGEHWPESDAGAAAAWIQSLPQGYEREAALHGWRKAGFSEDDLVRLNEGETAP